MSNRSPLNSAFTRAWVIDGQARPDHTPAFQNFLKLMGVDYNFGSVNPIFDPDESQYGQFVQTGEFRDAEERPSTSLVGHYSDALKSTLLDLARKGCAIDVQLHIGSCGSPGLFNSFTKALIFEGAFIESYGTDDLGALEPGEQGKVDETGDISAARMYEFVPIALAARTPSGVTNELLDVIICDSPSCGDCDVESDGCKKIMAISSAAGGSAGTPADVVFSLDGGQVWYFADVDTLAVAVNPTAIACVGSYVVVVADETGEEMHIALISEFTATTDPAFIQMITGFVANGGPRDIYSLGNIAYIVGSGGYVYKSDDIAAGVAPIDEGAATTANLNAVNMLSESFGVAAGDDGAIVTINNDLVSALTTSPVALGVDINTVFVKSKTQWFIGDNAGVFQYTLDAGVTWTVITLPGIAPTAITGIDMASDSVMYVSATRSGKGEIYVSIDGGKSFIRAPRDRAQAMPANDAINAIAACRHDVDFIAGVGLGADGADGFIVIGND